MSQRLMSLAYMQAFGLDRHELPDGTVIADLARGKAHLLNPTAAAVFELCDGTRDAEEIAQVLARLFHAAEPVEEEVEACLDKLCQLGLVEPVPRKTGP